MISVKKNVNPYYRFFNESEIPMAITDEGGIIVTCNRSFQTFIKTFSDISGDIKNMLFQDVLVFNEKNIFSIVVSHLTESGSNASSFVTSFESGNGFIHWLQIHSWLIEKQEGAEIAEGPFVGFLLKDLTEERKEEELLRAEHEIAKRAMQEKSQFLANMSHEIRTPIQTIIGMVELLQETILDREQIEYTRQVKFSADVLLYLINDVLDYSKIEAGKMELEEIDFDLESAIEQAVEMISIEAHKKGLELILDLPLEINMIAFGDPFKFRQIVINLVKNAVKFTLKGSVIISAKLTDFHGSKAVTVTITDTGIGIAKELQSRLFTTFFQGDVSNTRHFGGTGLGLSISKNLVGLMNGTIEMHSNKESIFDKEQGSVFSFTVPLKLSDKSFTGVKRGFPKDDYVLVVDDHPEANNRISSYLKDLGYIHIFQASSGKEALGMMKKNADDGEKFSLCLIDMVMPQMDGWRLAAEIKNSADIASSKLILMVPHGLLGADAKMTLLEWFDGYINKPIKRHSLKSIIDVVTDDTITELELAESEELLSEPLHEIHEIFAKNKPLIMIVEDHLVNQKLYSMIMEKIGYESILANDGQDAVEKADLNKLALIFMDIQMPRLNGYEAVEKLRNMGFTIPIIAVTASALSGEREKCMEVGFNDILVKPFKAADIEKMLSQWIDIGMKQLKEQQAKAKRANSNINKTIFDFPDALDIFMGDKEVVASVIEKFIEKADAQINDIRENILQTDFETGRRNAHTIKGGALTLSANELGTAAAELESAFKKRDMTSIQGLYPLLTTAFDRFKRELQTSGLYLTKNEIS
jgi:signal transduction histidine kinase/DNA-binding response OmpR family regulator